MVELQYPTSARSIAANVSVVNPAAGGAYSIVPGGGLLPSSWTLPFSSGPTRANNAIIGIMEAWPGSFGLYNSLAIGQSGDVIVDVSGCFAPASAADVGVGP